MYDNNKIICLTRVVRLSKNTVESIRKNFDNNDIILLYYIIVLLTEASEGKPINSQWQSDYR